MAGCPFRNFEECPEHDKKGGCLFWLSYSANKPAVNGKVEGCAITLTPVLLIEQINNLAIVAAEVSKVGAEVSAGRCENIKTGEAARQQLIALAAGKAALVQPDYSTTQMQIEGKVKNA